MPRNEARVRPAGATDIPAPTFGALNTTSNVVRIRQRIGRHGAELCAGRLVRHQQHAQKAVGALGAVGIGTGEFTVTPIFNSSNPQVIE
jgi:hypothetical protein